MTVNFLNDQVLMTVGAQSIKAYSRLSYTMWHALAEFIDNSTQSKENYESIITSVLKQEGQPLIIDSTLDKINKTVSINDNSIGMTLGDLKAALMIANPTQDSKGRSKYGMGMKTAAFWIGNKWQLITTEWGSGEEWTADINLDNASKELPIALSMKKVSVDHHYTKIVISGLNRYFQKRTEETIRAYIGSTYQFDIEDGSVKILLNDDEVLGPSSYELDTDPSGSPMRLEIKDKKIGGKDITGWVGILKAGAGGRRYGGFSLFQNRRQIQGFPNAWKPRSIFGGVDDEGANNLVAQRLTGQLTLDGFQVSHTKDSILFENDEEEELGNSY